MARLKVGALGFSKSKRRVPKILVPAEKEELGDFTYESTPIDFSIMDHLGECLITFK